MSGKNNPLSGSVNEIKKSIGHIVPKANLDILDLQKGYKKLEDGGSLSMWEIEEEKSLKEKMDGLKAGIDNLEGREGYVENGKLEKLLKMMKMTLETGTTILDKKDNACEISEDALKEVQIEVQSSLDDVKLLEVETEKEVLELSKTLFSLAGSPINIGKEQVKEETGEEKIKNILENLDPSLCERYLKLKEELARKMIEQTVKLETIWKKEKNT